MKSKIIAHQIKTFAKIMLLDGIKASDMLESLSLEANTDQVFKSG